MQVPEWASKLFLLTVFMSEVYTYYMCVHKYMLTLFVQGLCLCPGVSPATWSWMLMADRPQKTRPPGIILSLVPFQSLGMLPVLGRCMPSSLVGTGDKQTAPVLTGLVSCQAVWGRVLPEDCCHEECAVLPGEAGSGWFIRFSLHDMQLKTDNPGKQHPKC